MFCSECGAKAIEGALFCPKCGAKLMTDDVGSTTAERSVQTVMQEPAEPMASKEVEGVKPEISKPDEPVVSEAKKFAERDGQATAETNNTFKFVSAEDVYNLLREIAPNCPGINKTDFRQETGITTLKGKKNRYFIGFSRGDYRLSVCPRFLFSIHRIIFWFAILVTVSLLLEGADWEEIYPLLGLCLLIGGVGGIVSEVICRREKKEVVPFIMGALSKTVCVKGPVAPILEPLVSHPGLWFLGFPLPIASVIQPILYSLAALIGGAVLIFSPMMLYYIAAFGYDAYDDTYNDRLETDQYMPSSTVEDILLTKIYADEEGFSFMYPDDWEIEDVEEVYTDALVSVACTGMLGTYARIMVSREIDDGYLFAVTKSDIEESYSSGAGLNDLKVVDLSDMELDGCPARKLTIAYNNDAGARLISIQYFYIQESYMYIVTCVVDEDNYDRYEPRFNAIMKSYSIMAAKGEYDVGMQTQNYENNYLFDEGILAGEYEGENVMPSSYMFINIYSSPEDDMVGNYSITIPRSGLEYTGELRRESDRTFALVSNGEIYAAIEVIDETFGAVVIHYSENDFECNYRMYEAYSMP